ncbi:MAG TPA: glycosyltransferase [Candidatus Binatia bacterium]|nr:glycosyltransferase [Candidatus Binatia bacterium]
MGTSGARVTIVVVARDRFSVARRSLESILAETAPPFDLVYVDGRSPRRVGRWLRRQALVHGFRLIRSDRYLSPNVARAMGMERVTTPYAVIIDNDVVVTSGWLDPLVRCADETGACAVNPLHLEGDDPARRIIHAAGAFVTVEETATGRVFSERHRHLGEPLSAVPTPFVREPCDLLEYHCMLVRTDEFRRSGALDPAIVGTRDHMDACLSMRAAGGTLWFEPASQVVFLQPPPIAWSDYPYFLLRWSEHWTGATLAYFEQKWGARPQPLHYEFPRAQRRIGLYRVRRRLHQLVGPTMAGRLMRRVVEPLELRFNRHVVPRLWG